MKLRATNPNGLVTKASMFGTKGCFSLLIESSQQPDDAQVISEGSLTFTFTGGGESPDTVTLVPENPFDFHLLSREQFTRQTNGQVWIIFPDQMLTKQP